MGTISTRIDDNDVTIIGDGTLDLYAAPELAQRLREACRSADSVTVDLQAVDFIDSAIEGALAGAALAMHKRGKRLKVAVVTGGQPDRTLKLMSFDAIMDIEPTPAE